MGRGSADGFEREATSVGADAAAVGGIADHEVIESAVRKKTELSEQLVGLIIMQIDTLNQQGPVFLLTGGELMMRTMLHFPLLAKIPLKICRPISVSRYLKIKLCRVFSITVLITKFC